MRSSLAFDIQPVRLKQCWFCISSSYCCFCFCNYQTMAQICGAYSTCQRKPILMALQTQVQPFRHKLGKTLEQSWCLDSDGHLFLSSKLTIWIYVILKLWHTLDAWTVLLSIFPSSKLNIYKFKTLALGPSYFPIIDAQHLNLYKFKILMPG